jgi:nucleotide-binding universal stress UspA family protein
MLALTLGEEETMKILFATDGSECARAAGRLLASLPLPTGASVRVLSAVLPPIWVEPMAVGEGPSYPWLREMMEQEEALARRAAEQVAAELGARGVEAVVQVMRQNPADAILEQAQKDGAELIVVGSHGKGAVERFLIGSVSERVARYAHCSVLVVREPAAGGSLALRRAVVAVDGSESAEHALEALARLPLPSEMETRVVHVQAVGLPLMVPMITQEVIDQYDREAQGTATRIVEHAQERLRKAGRATTTEIRRGAAGEELVAAAREAGADLLVVGSANRSALGRLFLGSVSAGVLHHAPCSVLVARAAGGGA